MKPPLLFICHRLPVPPNKGDKIRSFNILKYLSEHFSVYLVGFVDDKNDIKHISDLDQYCVDYYIEEKSKLKSMVYGLTGFLTRSAITLPFYFSRKITKWVNQRCQAHNIHNVFVYSSAMAQYVMQANSPRFNNFVMDFVDVDSDKWRQYAKQKTGIARWFYQREARLLENFEVEVFQQASTSVFVSQQEADFFNQCLEKRQIELSHKRAQALNNGVDYTFFNPRLDYPIVDNMPEQSIVFTGAMDYWPNVAAVTWFAKAVWPQVVKVIPEAIFYIVGSNPSEEVLGLHEQKNIRVTGRVEDVRPYISQAKLVIAPLQIARGIQNKVLEGMAMEKPIVLSKLAGEGISVESMEGYFICEAVDDYVQNIATLMSQETQFSVKNREFVQQYFDWQTQLQRLKGKMT